MRFIDRNIAQPGDIVIDGVDQAKVTLRNLDPARMAYSVLGAEFDLKAIAASLKGIHARAEQRTAELNR